MTLLERREFCDTTCGLAIFQTPKSALTRHAIFEPAGLTVNETCRREFHGRSRAGVPIFCPASPRVTRMGLSQGRIRSGVGHIYSIGDLSRRPPGIRATHCHNRLGGAHEEFHQPASVSGILQPLSASHYAVQIVTDVPHFGGLRVHPEEAQSWGKLATDAAQVTVHADATIALPILATALARSSSALAKKRSRPDIDPSRREMVIDGVAISCETFEETE